MKSADLILSILNRLVGLCERSVALSVIALTLFGVLVIVVTVIHIRALALQRLVSDLTKQVIAMMEDRK